jgi:phosphatidate cytidylyltransferase
MALRVLTSVVLIPLVVALVWWGPPAALAAAAALVAGLSLWEFFSLADRLGLRAYRKWTLFCVALLFYAQYSLGLVETHHLGGRFSLVRDAAAGDVSIEAALLVFLFGCVAIGLASRGAMHDVLPSMAASAVGLIFIALPFSYLIRLGEIERVGRELVLFTLCLIWAGDMLAYFVGRSLGRIPMAPRLSPKKTWEGAMGNLLASLIVGVLFARWLQVEAMTLLIVAGLGNIAGQAGDLIESAYKRGAAVKDSGTIVPGHGGVLDRIDSLILAAPVVWAAYQWLGGR